MTRIERKFLELRAQGQAALIPFIVAGDPSLESTLELVLKLEARGADLIELGIPFSDPMADGPANQRALARGLASGASLPAIISLVREIRAKSEIPIILFGYYNPFYRYGCERLCKDLAEAQVDGILAVDVPPEESEELARPARFFGLNIIRLLAPTTPIERCRRIARMASGFLYYISVTGVTGTREILPSDLKPRINELRAVTSLPIGVGFGISTPSQAAEVACFADAVVVGSAFSLLLEKYGDTPDGLNVVAELAGQMKQAMVSARSFADVGPNAEGR